MNHFSRLSRTEEEDNERIYSSPILSEECQRRSNMRRAIKERLSGFLDDPEKSNEQRPMTDRMRDFVRDKGTALVSTVQEHLTSMTDTTGTLAKQKLLQTLLATGKIQSEHIRHGLQIGIGHFFDPSKTSSFNLDNYLQRQRFPSVGGVTPPHNQPDFDIEAHGLGIFLALMQIYGIDCSTLRDQVCRGELKEIVNPSSSGSLIYLTSNSSYLIKTLRDYDAKLIQQRFLQAYFQYVQQRPDTFLAKLFGVFGYVPYLSSQHNITVDSFTLRFAIFANFVPVNLDIHEKYDLKGSTYRRDADIKERMKSSTTFKDNDFRDLHPNGLRIPRQVYEHLTEVLARDIDFLQQLNIMDYSLLLIVHNIDNPVKAVRPGSLEALMGAVGDRFLIGMNEQKEERQRQNEGRRSSPRLRFKKPMETLGFRYEEMPMFDVDYAKEYGGIPAINEKDERLLLFVGIIDILQTFDICKVMQRQYQTVENRDVVAERSIVEPDFYARRFRDFIFNQVFRPVDSVTAPARASIYPSLLFPF